jgi:predicted phosphodiesterase
MNNQNSLDKLNRVQQLLANGFGRRRIAKEMQISEWEARALIGIVSPDMPVNAQSPTRVRTPPAINPKSNKIVSQTTISVVPNAQTKDSSSTSDVVSRNSTLKVACISDVHYPYQDQKAEEIALAFLSDYKPDVIVWNGDIFDFYAVSQYEKNINKKMNIQDEIDYGVDRIRTWMETIAPKKAYFRQGNHESRLARLANKAAPALTALRSLSLEANVDFKSLGIEFIPDHQDLFIGSLLFIHGTVVRKHGGNSARGHYEQYGCSVMMGHTHRLAVTYKRSKHATHTLIENGTLCDFDVEYAQFPDWQQGFTTIEFDGDDFSVQQRPIIDYKLIANGKVYTK